MATVLAITTKGHHSKVDAKALAQIWRIRLGPTQQTLKTTTQVGIRHDVHPLSCWYKTDIIHGCNSRRFNTTMYFDTLFPEFRSLNVNTCAQLFTDTEIISLHPSNSKAEAGNFFNKFIDDIRIPMNMRFYHAEKLLLEGTEFMKTIKKHSINWSFTGPYSHWKNRAEGGVKRISFKWKITMRRTGCSPRLWDYGMKHDDELLSWILTKYGRPPLENLTVDTIDLSEYLDSDFYDMVWYRGTLSGEKGEAFPGRWLGISHRFGTGMCYWVLNKKGNVISRSTVQHVTKEDILNPKLKETLELSDKKIKEKLADEKHELESCPGNKFFQEYVLLDKE